MSCDCEFAPDPSEPEEEPTHYARSCLSCGRHWFSLHCPHDGHQTPCPDCGVLMAPQKTDEPLLEAAHVFIQSARDYTELAEGPVQDETQLVIDWGRKGVGFGMLLFYERDGAFGCDNETMGRQFCKGVLLALAQHLGTAPMPPMLSRFTGDTYEERIDKMLDACRPRGGW